MPRTGKGGAREGAVGKQYSNRTDLSGGKMPISAVSNQEYGEAGAQRIAQSAVPMGTPNVSVSPPQVAQQSLQAPAQVYASTPPVQPGSLPYLHPTNRPDEPVTAGLPFGEGPGPTIIPPPSNIVSNTLTTLANHNSSSAMQDLVATARSLGL